MAALTAVLAWAGTAFCPEGLGAAALTGAVLAALFTAFCLGLGARLIFLRPLKAVGQRLRDLAEGRLDAAQAFRAEDLPAIHAGLDAALRALKFERGLSRGVFQGLPMPYLLVDAQERTTSTNQACLDMLEIDDSVESCLGKTLAELFYNDPARETAVGKSIRNGEYFRNLDIVITGHKGRKIDVLANIFPIYDEDKACIGGLCLYVDMTALKRAEQLIMDKNERMALVARSLEEAVGRISGISGGLSRGIQQSDSGAAVSAQRLAEAAASMNEMNATVREVAKNAEAASGASALTREKAEAGAQVVEKAVRSIKQVHQLSLDLREDMGQLDEHARSINRIMNVISDIADQTNLLALNAAIEAARAGDAGRGFAVVADEVRKLAEKTMASTHDVSSAIQAIQESTNKSMASVENAVLQIDKATGFANDSGHALTDIVSTAEATADQIQAIAAASEQQSAASEEINANIERVNNMVGQTAESMAEAAGAVAGLAAQTEGLRALVARMQQQ
mgnify:CR=1 FL=1